MEKKKPSQYTVEEIDELLTKIDLVRTSEIELMDCRTKVSVVCSRNHESSKTIASIIQQRKCQKCLALSNEIIDSLLPEGWIRLTDYITAWTKINFICGNGHSIWKNWHSIQQGKLCDECNPARALRPEEIEEIVVGAGYSITKPYNPKTRKIGLRCDRKHETEMYLKHFMNGHRCRHCNAENMSGEGHPLWRHDLTTEERERKRLYSEYDDWREFVFQRDDYSCQVCLERGGEVNAHHLYGYASYPEFRTNVSNGITLCANHHTGEDGYHQAMGIKNATPQRFLLWIHDNHPDRLLDIYNLIQPILQYSFS